MQAEVNDLTFEEWWAELSDAVRAWLLRRRVPPHLVDDIVQETGFRLFKMWDEIDVMRSPRGLAFTIASNLLWDERNRRASREIVGEVPEQSCEDVERAGIARLELARVKRAMSRLNPQQRSVLLAEIGHEAIPDGNSAAVKMMRMRARRRLTALLESAPAGAFVLLHSPLRLWRMFRSARRSSALSIQTAAIIAACTTIAVVGIPPSQPAIGRALDATASRTAPVHAAAAVALSGIDAGSTANRGQGGAAGAMAEGGAVSAMPRDQVHVDVGDGTPVRGHADVSVGPGEDFDVEVPECSVEPTETNEVRVRCHAQAGDKEVTADASLGVGP